MRKNLLLLLLFAGSIAAAQQSINNYQYVIVPSKFNFLKENDEYHLNTLTKLLLEKYGFKAYLDSEPLPDEILDRNCNKLYAVVDSYGNFITTKMKVTLKDCKNNILFTSAEGKSKEKEYGKSYNLALRDAFESFASLQYRYVPVVEKPMESVSSPRKTEATKITSSDVMLFAQPIPNGYQLVDSTPKVVMKIYKTLANDRYVAIRGEVYGELISKNGEWFFEYYLDEHPFSEKTGVRF